MICMKTSVTKNHAPIVRLSADFERVIYAISYIICVAEKNGPLASQYDIVKTLFLADRQHLNEWGRLITNDNYVAMKHGPVPSLAFDLLKESSKAKVILENRELPWQRKKLDQTPRFFYHSPLINDFDNVLSESDTECLENNLNVVQTLGFGQIRKITHDDIAYIDAWDDLSSRKQFPMSLGMLFNTPDFDKAQEIAELSGFD